MDVHTGEMLTLLGVPDDGVLVHLWVFFDSAAEHARGQARSVWKTSSAPEKSG